MLGVNLVDLDGLGGRGCELAVLQHGLELLRDGLLNEITTLS